ncbi:MAG: FG-GAP-like repeat-containing protein [Myxococcales bacterium]
MRLLTLALIAPLAACIVPVPSNSGPYCTVDAGCPTAGSTGTGSTSGGSTSTGGSTGGVCEGSSTGASGSSSGGTTGSSTGLPASGCPAGLYDPSTDDFHCGGSLFSDGGCDPGFSCAPGAVCLGSRCTRPSPMLLGGYGLAAAHREATGIIYAVGGGIDGAALPLAQIYDAHQNVWTAIKSPSARELLGAAWGDDGKLHAVGGVGVGPGCDLVDFWCQTNEAYDPSSSLWSEDVSLSVPTAALAVTADSNGVLYAVGGAGALFLSTSKELYRNDPASDGGWQAQATMGTARQSFAAGFEGSDGGFYAAGGFDGTVDLKSAEVWDPATDQWSRLPDMPRPLRYLAGAASDSAFVVTGGGTSPSGTGPLYQAVTDVTSYSCGGSGSCGWARLPSLVQARGGHGAVWGPGGRLYVFGGVPQFDGTLGSHKLFSALPTVEVWDPRQPDGGWVSSICPASQLSFSAPSGTPPQASGTRGISLAVGDLNGDGYPDVVAASDSPGQTWTLSSFLNNQGTLSAGPVSPPADGGTPHALALADFNNDKTLDVAVATEGDGLAVALGAGGGSFQAPTVYSSGGQPGGSDGGDVRALAIGDFDGNQRPDIAVSNSRESTVAVFLNQGGVGSSGFSSSSFAVCAGSAAPIDIATADFDATGNQDLAVLCTQAEIQIYSNDGHGTFTLAPSVISASGGVSLAVTDFNLDGLPDLVVGTALTADNTLEVQTFLNQPGSPGTFVAGPSAAVPIAACSNENDLRVAIGDFNADGYPDIVTAEFLGGNSYVFLNDGTGNGLALAGTYPSSEGTPRAAATADLRLDGWTDFLALDYTDNSLSVWLNGCPP